MKTLLMMLTLLFSGAAQLIAAPALKQLPGDHIIVFYQVDEAYARDVLHHAERLYAGIMRNLGADQLAKPWLGDQRCKITLYKDEEAFKKRAQGVTWAEGWANYQAREIFAYNGNPNLMDAVLPHEMTHVIFRDIMGNTREIPLWLDEGVALSQEPGRREQLYPIARKAIEAGKFLPFDAMTNTREAKDLDTEKAAIFYAESLATVDFLLETFHRDKFLKFCRQLREGLKLQEALLRVYGTDRIASLKALQERVMEYLGRMDQGK